MRFQIDYADYHTYLWRLLAEDGRILAIAAQKFLVKTAAIEAIGLVMESNSMTCHILTSSVCGPWRWELQDRTWRTLAMSADGFNEEIDARRAASLVLSVDFQTPIDDLTGSEVVVHAWHAHAAR